MSGVSHNQDSPSAQYFVDMNLAKRFSQSLPFLIFGRLCFSCSSKNRAEEAFPSNILMSIVDIVSHCAKQPDYLLPDTPLKEAIFRVLLVNGPMDSEQISDALSEKWSMSAYPRIMTSMVIQRLLEDGIYNCVGTASDQDAQDWRSQLEDAIRKKQGAEDKSRSTTPNKKTDPKRHRHSSKKTDLPALRQPEIRVENPSDPFAQTSEPIRKRTSAKLGSQFEKFLYWLSAGGGGTWQTFVEACLTLDIVEERQHARSVLRRLRLLGHVDCSQDGSRWEVSPAALVTLPSEPDKGFLTGQRLPSELGEEGSFHTLTHQPDYQGPPRVELPSDGSHALTTAVGETSTELAEILPTIDEWKNSLQQMPKLLTTQFDLQLWDGRRFQPCNTFYEKDGKYHGISGMYRLRSVDARFQYDTTLFFDEPSQRWLRGDWYGLRFLAVGAGAGDVIYEKNTNSLLIAEAQRWPLLYERALVLASGLLPEIIGNRNWLRYQRMPLALAETLCHKLKLRLQQETKDA